MAKITISGIPAYNGEYQFDASSFTGRELHVIKQISGVRAGELSEALAAGDYDLVVAFTVVTLTRHGFQGVSADQILEADVGAITVDLDDAEAVEEIPPASAPQSGGADDDSEPKDSGSDSSNGSGDPQSLPSPTGQPG